MVDIIYTARVFLPKCPLTTVRRRFSADDLQIVRGEADDTCVVKPHLKSASNGCKRTRWKTQRRVQELTYMTLIGNFRDRKSRISKFDDKTCKLMLNVSLG